MNQRVKSLALAAAIAVTAAFLQAPAESAAYTFPTGQPLNPAFQGIISPLKSGTNVPVLLPVTLVGSPNTIVGQIVEVSTNSFTVQVSMGSQCPTAMYCRFGTVHGELTTSQTPPLTGIQVPFEPGITGYYLDAVCHANCNESVLGFDYNGYQYTIGILAAPQANILTTAQSLAQY
jgi:hypothetical protein